MDWLALGFDVLCLIAGYFLGRLAERWDRRDEDAILKNYEREMEDYFDER